MNKEMTAALALIVLALASSLQTARADGGSYARIAWLSPRDGDTVDFEAGYIRHLEWHRQAKDPWAWYGWTVWAGDRQRSFVYATFGHSAAELDDPVSPAEDERDNVANVAPHAHFSGNALYEYLPALSRGSGTPRATSRLEMTSVEIAAGSESAFEGTLGAEQPSLEPETLWFKLVAGGTSPRYMRLRARPNLSALLDGRSGKMFPVAVNALVLKTTVEILTFRPAMSYGAVSIR